MQKGKFQTTNSEALRTAQRTRAAIQKFHHKFLSLFPSPTTYPFLAVRTRVFLKPGFFRKNKISRLWFRESFNSRILGIFLPGSLRNTCSSESTLLLLGMDSKHSANKVQECARLASRERESGFFARCSTGDDRFTRFQAYRVFSGDATMARYAERRRNKRARRKGEWERVVRCCLRCTKLPSDSKSAVASSVFHPSYFFSRNRSGCLRTHPTIVAVNPLPSALLSALARGLFVLYAFTNAEDSKIEQVSANLGVNV